MKRDRLAITVERKGTSSWIALRHPSHSSSMSGTQGTTLEEKAPRGVGFRGQTLKTIRTECACKSHTSSLLYYTWGTPGINNCGGPICRFPFRYWGNLLCAYWSPWSTFFLICFQNGTVRMSQKVLLQFFCKLWVALCYCHTSFLLYQSLPHPFWGGIYWARPMPLFSWI